ncbi:MAG: prealbumin-like fold domain-containing protein [Candidatus Limnocylindrales bacterium]
MIDDNATSDVADDVLLDGARLEVRAEDGDRRYDPIRDPLVFGPRAASDGLLETHALDSGWYWIVETRAPKGFIGSAPILVELNLDPTVTCVWDRGAPSLCRPSVGEADSTSCTLVLVYSTPSAPAPGVADDPARGPSITLPPTHVMDGTVAPAPAGVGWTSVVAAFAVFTAVVLGLRPVRRPQRQGPKSTRTPGSTNSIGPS